MNNDSSLAELFMLMVWNARIFFKKVKQSCILIKIMPNYYMDNT